MRSFNKYLLSVCYVPSTIGLGAGNSGEHIMEGLSLREVWVQKQNLTIDKSDNSIKYISWKTVRWRVGTGNFRQESQGGPFQESSICSETWMAGSISYGKIRRKSIVSKAQVEGKGSEAGRNSVSLGKQASGGGYQMLGFPPTCPHLVGPLGQGPWVQSWVLSADHIMHQWE